MRKNMMVALVLTTLTVGGFVGVGFFARASNERDMASRLAEVRQERRARQEKAAQEWEARRQAQKARDQERDAEWAKRDAEAEAARQKLVEDIAKAPPPKKRRVKRYAWESPVETRGKIWNIPEEESELDTLTAFLRVCMAEADGHQADCIGIWQVVRNNRRRSCDRANIRRITECDAETGEETFLSALRRHQRHVLGYIPFRNKRAMWIAELTTDCENPPDEYYPDEPDEKRLNLWDSRYQQRCSNTVVLGRHLMENRLPPSVPGHRAKWLPGRPITWGGRCESGKASCDDRVACARGLARIKTDTYNAFWRRPRTPDEVDPICAKLGYGDVTINPDEGIEIEPVETAEAEEPEETGEPRQGG